MSELAALELAAIREWVAKARGIVAGEMGQADWLEAFDWEATELGGTVLDALTRLTDDLTSCRAERDALRAAAQQVLLEPHHWCQEGQVVDRSFTKDGTGLLGCSCPKAARDARLRAALGEVAQ